MQRHCKFRAVFCAVMFLLTLCCFIPRVLDRYVQLENFGGHFPRDNIRRTELHECKLDDNIVFTKRFLYLIQTESCVPAELLASDVFGDSSVCQCDLIVLGYKHHCEDTLHQHITHIFNRSTTWTTGREYLYRTARNSRNTYMYYIFMDDDVRLRLIHLDETRNPWRLFEDFLIRVRPPIAASDNNHWNFVDRVLKFRGIHGCATNHLEEYVPALFFDGMFDAFHHDAVKNVLEPLFPYWHKFDRLSWWYSQTYVCALSDLVYHHQAVHNVELMGQNDIHRPYTRRKETPAILEHIFRDVEGIVPKELQAKAHQLLQVWRQRSTEYELLQRGYDSYCVFSTQYGCVEPYQYLKQL